MKVTRSVVLPLAIAGALLAGGMTLTAAPTAYHLAPGEAISVDCPTTPNLAPVSALEVTIACPGSATPSPSESPATPAPTSTPQASPSPQVTPNPTTSPAAGTVTWGSAINADTKANLQVNGSRVAHIFRSTSSSPIASVRFAQRGGAVYSAGSGGSVRVSVQAVTAAGVPTGTVLASTTYAPGNPSGNWARFDAVTFSSPAAIAKGSLGAIVIENTASSPNQNYFSVNETFVYGATLVPRQPRFADADYAVLYGSSSWSTQRGYTAVMDVAYADGAHDGDGFIGMIGINGQAVYAGAISGSNQVRETLTPASSLTVSSASVRIRRTAGSDPLLVSLVDTTGKVVASGSVPASSVPITSSGGDTGGASWVTVTFPTVAFAGGDLRLSTASSSTWTAAPIRDGADSGFAAALGFPFGVAQLSTNAGGSWSAMYSSAPLDLQFYLR